MAQFLADLERRGSMVIYDWNRMLITMTIRFEYEYNGKFYWTNKYDILVIPYSNRGWTPQGPKYIDKDGKFVNVRYSQPVRQPRELRLSRSEDVGRIVYTFVSTGMLRKQESDSKADFHGLFNLEE